MVFDPKECNLGWNHMHYFKITRVWFQTKIAQHVVQLPLYNIYFEITQIQDLVSSHILLMQYWAGLKLDSSIFWEEKIRVWETKVAKFAMWRAWRVHHKSHSGGSTHHISKLSYFSSKLLSILRNNSYVGANFRDD